MNKFSFEDFDPLISIEQRKDIILSLHQYDTSFEDGVEESIQGLKKSLEAAEVNHSYYQRKLTKDHEDIISLDMDEDAFDKMIEWDQQCEWLNSQLNALSEMKIIYLFKNLEISMKSLIKIAYPRVNTKSFYKWENIKLFFDEKKISLPKIDGYREVMEVKTVNNNIKHTDELSEELQKIPEFKSGMEFEHTEQFFKRVKPKVAIFQNKLNEAVISELFYFDDKKFTELVDDLKERMTKEDAEKLIAKLKAAYHLK